MLASCVGLILNLVGTNQEAHGVSDLGSLKSSILKIVDVVGLIKQYASDVVSGKIKEPDHGIGRIISETLSQLPRIPEFQGMFDNYVKDILMVVYLSNLTKAQLEISEKLHLLKVEEQQIS